MKNKIFLVPCARVLFMCIVICIRTLAIFFLVVINECFFVGCIGVCRFALRAQIYIVLQYLFGPCARFTSCGQWVLAMNSAPCTIGMLKFYYSVFSSSRNSSLFVLGVHSASVALSSSQTCNWPSVSSYAVRPAHAVVAECSVHFDVLCPFS